MTAKAWNWYQDVISQMEHKVLFGIFHPEKNRTTFSDVQPVNITLKNVPLEQTKKSCSIHIPTGFYGKVLWKVNNDCCH